MPLYDFKCSVCGTEFEVERAFGATGRVKCPSCGSTKTDKIFSATGIVFKGGGFYATDSRSGGRPDSSKPAAGKPSGADESKPASEKPAGDSDKAKPAADTAAPKKDTSKEKQ